MAEAREAIRLSEVKIARYRAAIDAGGDIAEISQWINQAKAERLQAEASLRTVSAPVQMTRDEVRAMVRAAAKATRIIQDADPEDKAAVYRSLNLVLMYQPASRTIHANAQLTADQDGLMVGVRGGT